MRIRAREAAYAIPINQNGLVRRRLTDEHELDIFLVNDPVSRVLALEVHLLPAGLRLPAVEVGDVVNVEHFDTEGVLRIGLLSADYADVFYVLVDDLVDSVIENSGLAAGGRALMLRLRRWERLLEASSKGMSLSAQKGLFGELTVLKQLANAIGFGPAVASWKGPEGGVRDFDLGGTAIEVKTTSARGLLTVRISSERQLENVNLDRLFLWCVSIEKNEAGLTINEMVDDVRALADDDEEQLSLLDERLSFVGYRMADRRLYNARFAVRANLVYHVADGFPRIISEEIANCVFDVSYSIDLEACNKWKVEPSTIWEQRNA
jgi:hypothetical protein